MFTPNLFISLNFTLNKTFGANKKSAIDLKVSNMLNSERRSDYTSFKAQDQIFSLREPGTEISLRIFIYFLKFKKNHKKKPAHIAGFFYFYNKFIYFVPLIWFCLSIRSLG